jgi:3-phenylpropionate/cinnamic acid dioxygenase small subunit
MDDHRGDGLGGPDDNWSQIQNVLAEYCHAIDEARFDDFERLFTSDATVSPRLAGTTYRGPAAIRAYLEAQPPEMRGLHVTLNPHIVTDGEVATVRADFAVLVPRGESVVIGAWGWYRDRLTYEHGSWRFSERQIDTQWRRTDTEIVR